jgi:hypothetical protein
MFFPLQRQNQTDHGNTGHDHENAEKEQETPFDHSYLRIIVSDSLSPFS